MRHTISQNHSSVQPSMGGAYTLHPYSGDKSTLPRPLRAVLRIATSSPELLNKFFPHIIIERQEINWDHVFGQDLSDGNTAAIHWAYSIWCGEALTRDPMGFSYSLDRRLALAVIEALMIAWSLDNDGK